MDEEIIYVEEEEMVVEVEETPITGINLATTNHALLENRDVADQHPMSAITGLENKLAQIEKLKTVFSDGRGYAEYYVWEDKNPIYDENMSREDRVGYFVSLITDIKTGANSIKISNENIYGVTVSKEDIAFIGGQSTINRDETYGLVCIMGTVKVYCADDVEPNTYVIPGKVADRDGCAILPTDDQVGYFLVISTGIAPNGKKYAVMNLTESLEVVKKTTVNNAKHAKTADNYTDDGNIKTEFDTVKKDINDIKDGTISVAKATEADHAQAVDNYTDSGNIKLKFDNVDQTIIQEVEDIVDGTTIVGIATNFIDKETINGKDIDVVRGIKEKFDGILSGETSALILNAGVTKDDLNFIVDRSWKPDPCGNYRSETSTTINNVTINGWQLKGMWIKDDKYIQILISEDKIFIRSLDKIDNVRTLGDWTQIAGDGVSVSHAINSNNAELAKEAENATTATIAKSVEVSLVGFDGNPYDLNDLKTTGYYFAHIATNTPQGITAGFVEVYQYTINNDNVVIQTFKGTHGFSGCVFERTYDKSNDWTEWTQTSGDGMIYTANYANEITGMSFTTDAVNTVYTLSIGSTLTLRKKADDNTLYIGCSDLTELYMSSHAPQYALQKSDLGEGIYFDLLGAWAIRGIVSISEDYKYYLIQRVK